MSTSKSAEPEGPLTSGPIHRLTTERLVLRCPTDADLDDMFAFFGDPQAMRYWSTAPHADRSVTQERLDRMKARFVTSPHYYCLDYNRRVIGCAGLVPPNEVGFILHCDYHRQGFVSEAMRAIIADIWSRTDLAELIADADPENAASIGLLAYLGFTETHRAEKTFFINGVWSDSVYFKLTRTRG